MTVKQWESIRENLYAFITNFGEPRIESGRQGCLYVFFPADSKDYIQACPDISYLNGWLYGCVQGALVVQHRAKEVRNG